MQIVNKDGSVLRSAKWLLWSHSNSGLSPLKFTCRSGMQHKNVCCFIMLCAYTGFLMNLFQAVRAVPCTNCPDFWRTKLESGTWNKLVFSRREKWKIQTGYLSHSFTTYVQGFLFLNTRKPSENCGAHIVADKSSFPEVPSVIFTLFSFFFSLSWELVLLKCSSSQSIFLLLFLTEATCAICLKEIL